MRQDVLQNLDEQILDVSQPYLDVALPENRRDVVVGVELRHQLKMDCYLDVVGVELRHQLKMDCYLDVVRELMALVQKVKRQRFQLHVLQPHALQPLPYLQSP